MMSLIGIEQTSSPALIALDAVRPLPPVLGVAVQETWVNEVIFRVSEDHFVADAISSVRCRCFTRRHAGRGATLVTSICFSFLSLSPPLSLFLTHKTTLSLHQSFLSSVCTSVRLHVSLSLFITISIFPLPWLRLTRATLQILPCPRPWPAI